MSKGPNVEVERRFKPDELRRGTTRLWEDSWHRSCDMCAGVGVHRNQRCAACTGSGFIAYQLRKPIEYKVPAGSRPGQRLRIRGYGYRGNPDTVENRGDLIVVLQLYGDGKVLDELQAISSTQKLSPARPVKRKLSR